MAIIFKLIVAYLLPWMVGYLVLSLFDRRRDLSAGYKVFAAFFLGIGLLTLQAFVVGIFGGGLGLMTFLAIIGVDLAVLLGLKFLLRGSQPHPARLPADHPLPSGRGVGGEVRSDESKWSMFSKILLLIFLLLLLLKAGASFWQVAHVPTYEFDAWNNWNLRGKVVYTEGEIPLDPNQPFYLGGGIRSYPLNDALWKVWLANLFGAWDEQLVNTYSVFFYLFLLGLFYFALPPSLSPTIKIIGTYLLASLPFLYFYSWIPYADLSFAGYLFLAGSGWFRFLQSRAKPYLFISAVGLALAIWTKNEGFAVALPVIVLASLLLVAIKKLSVRQFLNYWLVSTMVAAPWLIFRSLRKLEYLSGDSSSFELMINTEFFREAFFSVFLRSHFNFLWLLLFLLIIFQAKKIWHDPPRLYLSIIIIILFLFYNGIIIFTDKATDLSALVRVNLHIAPLAMFLVIGILREFWQSSVES